MPATFASTCSSVSSARSAVLPLGSPIRPVPPPTTRDRRVTAALQARERHHRQQMPDVQARRGGIESDVAGDLSRARAPRAGLRWRRTRGRATPTRHTGPSAATIQPSVWLLTRRAALKGVVATTVGAVTGAGAYGVGYERHHIGITEATLPVSGLAAGARRPAHRLHHRHSSQRDGARRRRARRRSSSSAARAPRPDRPRRRLRDVGRSRITSVRSRSCSRRCRRRTASSRSSATTTTTATCRRRSRRKHIAVLKDARTRVEIRGEALELAGIRFWTRRADRHRARRRTARATRCSCSRTIRGA